MHAGIPTGSIETEADADAFASAFLMPRRAFSRDFQAAKFSWNHVFALKRRWMASAAAIIRRAYTLELIGAIQYRQACKYMSFKGWTKGEPYEPKFQPPELLAAALNGLGTKVRTTIPILCSELHFLPETFADVTGFAVPQAAAARGGAETLKGTLVTMWKPQGNRD